MLIFTFYDCIVFILCTTFLYGCIMLRHWHRFHLLATFISYKITLAIEVFIFEILCPFLYWLEMMANAAIGSHVSDEQCFHGTFDVYVVLRNMCLYSLIIFNPVYLVVFCFCLQFISSP